jgi:serine/threonine protein kinase
VRFWPEKSTGPIRMTLERKRRAYALLREAIERPSDEHAAFIAEHCADDAALAQELGALLDASRHNIVIDRPAADIVADFGFAPAYALMAGQRVGAWLIVREIGQGGMGRVYLAERADGQYEQAVALKVVLGELTSDAAVARFVAERRILARLDHPGIASLVDGGVDERGRPWFAMQYVDGMPLPTFCERHALGLDARLRLVIAICEAVAYAHRQLVVHCDLKPSNVLIDTVGNPRLLDFGIARLIDPDGTHGEKTQTQLRALTPGYAAPEQLAGAPVGIGTDVYALGTMLYEILAGARPYEGSDLTPAGIVVAQARGEPPLLSRAARTQSPIPSRLLRGDLELIVAKSLRHEPAQRYRDAEALAADLRHYLDGRAIEARPHSVLYRWRKFARRNRIAVAATAAIAVVLVGATIVSLREASLAREQAARAQAQAARAEAVQAFINSVFQQASPEENKGAQLTAHQLLEKAEQQMQRLDAQPSVRADIGVVIGGLYGEISDFDRAQAVLKEALAVSQSDAVPDDVKARALIGISDVESESNAYDAALDHARAALSLLQRSGSSSAATIALAHVRIGQELGRKGDNVAAQTMLRDALQTDRAALGDRNESVIEEWGELATVLGNIGRYDESAAAFDKMIDGTSALWGANSLHVAHALNELSNMLDDKGDLRGSEDALRRALAIRMATVGPDHHDTMINEHNLLVAIELQGRFAEALPQRIRLLERQQHSGSAHPRDLAATFGSLGRDYAHAARFADAESALREALAINERAVGPKSPVGNSHRGALSSVLMYEGRYADAEAVQREAVDVAAAHDPPGSIALAKLRSDLGTVLRAQHRYREAVAIEKQAADAFATGAKKGNPWHPDVLANLALAEIESGDAAQARVDAEKGVALARENWQPGEFRQAMPLLALARTRMNEENYAEAEPLLREALRARTSAEVAAHPCVLEIEVELIRTLVVLGRADPARASEATQLTVAIAPALKASESQYLADLRKRLASN